MRNLHTLIVGRTGSGKTTLARALVRMAARVVVLDRKMEYDTRESIACYSFAEFADTFMSLRFGAFCISFRPSLESDYGRAMTLVRAVQRSEPHGPLVLTLEEASNYGNQSGVDENVRQLYNAGRHERISMLSIVQVDTDFHRVARYGSEIVCTFYQHKLSGDMQSMFKLDDVMQLTSLKHDYTEWPEQGRHFLTYPDDIDLYEQWADAHNFILTEDTNNEA